MAYAAVASVTQILEQLLYTSQYPLQYPKPQIESLYLEVCSLLFFLERIVPLPRRWRSELGDLEIQIRDAMYRAQDAIELFISRQTRSSEFEEIPGDENSILPDLTEIIAELGSIRDAEEITGSIKEGMLERELLFPPLSESTAKSARIVGRGFNFDLVTDGLLEDASQLQIISILGAGGIGKTTLAKSIYDDLLIKSQFPIRAWVTVSQEYNVGRIFLNLSNSMEINGKKVWNEGKQGSVEQLSANLYQALANSRYLIILDDVWDNQVWNQVRTSFPDNKKGSRIILTTRDRKVATGDESFLCHEMRPMSLRESWTLLCGEALGYGRICPPHLIQIGTEIAKKCGGVPLLISVVGRLLSKQGNDLESWRSIEEYLRDAARSDENKHSDMLSISYNYLPAKLRGCFLYMGAFPEDSEISASNLIKLWIAEGFMLSPSPPLTLEQVAQQHLEELIDRNLISVCKVSSSGRIKTCGIHDDLRDLAMAESRRNNFVCSIKKGDVGELAESTQSERRISIHRNVIVCMKDVYQRVKSNKFARTLVYAGFDYHYPLPFCLTFELLRVLDALKVYFIEFPNVLVELIHLRYLALTYNGKLPPSLSRLTNLQTLIVHRHPKYTFFDTSILPVQVWSMVQMRHLLIPEFDLPHPLGAQSSVILKNLQSLSNVNSASCTKEVLQSMPNLKKLAIWVEAPGSVNFYASDLQQLDALKFTVLKPIPGEKSDFLPTLAFPMSLRKLSLSGCGIPWEDMTVIGELPRLQVLKLRNSAFQGRVWLPSGGQFLELKYLLLESLDLMHLSANNSHFPSLQRMIIRHCCELVEFGRDIDCIRTLELIELVDCSLDAVKWAEGFRKYQNDRLQVRVISSWE